MKIPKYITVCLLVLSGPGLKAQEEASFPGVEALMTDQEYRSAGLARLTPAEREALNQWLVKYTAEDSQYLLNTDEEVKQAVQAREILAVIQPPFTGWSGKTVFVLDNGQVWQQRRRGNYFYTGATPEVRITTNAMGFFRMELVENGKTVQVKRLK